MAVMSYKHWKDQTSRGIFTPRSKALKDLGDAFEKYDGHKSPKTLIDLFNALLAWIASKSDWKNSTRNSNIETSGKGTMETLLDQLIKENPAFGAKAAPYLTKAAAPTRELVNHGDVVWQKDADGKQYEVWKQQEENSCGPCSIRMVVRLVRNKDVGEQVFRHLAEIAEDEKGYTGTLGKGGVLSGGSHDWSPSGGGTWMVPAALKAMHIPNELTKASPGAILLKSSAKKPAIGVVAWTTGGLHYVVAVGRNSAGNLTILDPHYGIQTVDVTGGTLGQYKPLERGAQAAVANWHPWVCSVL